MTDTREEILAALRKQEAVLSGLLRAVRHSIQMLSVEHATVRPAHPHDNVDLLIDQVLARLGEQFTSAEIFETAKRVKPGLARGVLKTMVDRLLRHGLIHKIEDGRGRRPARYQKHVVN